LKAAQRAQAGSIRRDLNLDGKIYIGM